MSYTSTAIKRLRYLINRDTDQLLVLEKNNGAFDIISLDTPAARDAAISVAVNNLLAGVPGALDTLNELATALGDDANFAATVTTALGNRLVWKGDWTPSTNYVRNDLVMINGGLYVAPGNFTSGLTFHKTSWKELAPQLGTYAGAVSIDSIAVDTLNDQIIAGKKMWTGDNEFKTGRPSVDVQAWGVLADGVILVDGVMNGTDGVLNSVSASFAITDVGKVVTVKGAGVGGIPLSSTILAWQSSTQVTLADSSSMSVTNSTVIYGTDDTSGWVNAIAQAVSRGHCDVVHNVGVSMTGTLACSGLGIKFKGKGTLAQRAHDHNIIDLSNSSNCSVFDLNFVGAGGLTSRGSNVAIYADTAIRPTIINNTGSGFCEDFIQLANCTDILVEGNRGRSLSGGMLFVQCSGGSVSKNIIRDPQTPANYFIHGISFDSKSAFPGYISPNTDLTINGNVVVNYVNAQGILAHRLLDSTIANNVFENCLDGIGLIRTSVVDVISFIVVTGNIYIGTSTVGAAAISNYGIQVGGASGFPTDHVSIVANVVQNANAVVQAVGQGGIGIGYANATIVRDNIVSGAFCNGIVINNPCIVFDITGNEIDGVVNANGQQAGIELTSAASTSTGVIGRNVIDGGSGLVNCLRSDMTTTGVVLREQTLLGTWTNAITNPNKAATLVNPGFGGGQSSIAGANPPASGTTYRNNTGRFVRVEIAARASVGGTDGTVVVKVDNVNPAVASLPTRWVSGSTTATQFQLVDFVVPPGCFWSVTLSGVTLGTCAAMAV